VRPLLAVLAAAAVGVVAGVALGEYAFDGLAIVGAGLVVGLFVSEAAVGVARAKTVGMAVACAAFTVMGLIIAARTATGHRLSTVRWEGWLAVALGAAAAAVRAAPLRRRSRTPAEPPPEA
jgi:hypothetical protein